MRGEIVHRIYGVHEGRAEDTHFGTHRTVAEAEAAIARLREQHGSQWADNYHNRGFVIREATVETDFQIPELPKPRDKYVAVSTAKPNQPGTWNSTTVRVFRRGPTAGELLPICEFERNYSMLQTFEPFRKDGRDFALVSRDYTKTAVLDLTSGQIVAEETETSPGAGFCPVGFYVPSWWDLHDGSVIPGSPWWDSDREWPSKPFGLVWGCYWGDDSSWKVQYLDLDGITDGVIKREERFGYLEIATTNYLPPSLNPEWASSGQPSKPPTFIQISRSRGQTNITLSVQMQFDLSTGACHQWQRTGSPFD